MYAASTGLFLGATLRFTGSFVARARYSADVLSGPTEGKMFFGRGSLPLTKGFQRGVVRGGCGISMNRGDSGATCCLWGVVVEKRRRQQGVRRNRLGSRVTISEMY